jgi:hypothetical protein
MASPAIAVGRRVGGACRCLHRGRADCRQAAPVAARLEGAKRGAVAARVGSLLGLLRGGDANECSC